MIEINATSLAPFVTWGTNPGMVVAVTARVPELQSFTQDADRRAAEQALAYMDLKPGNAD